MVALAPQHNRIDRMLDQANRLGRAWADRYRAADDAAATLDAWDRFEDARDRLTAKGEGRRARIIYERASAFAHGETERF